MVRLGLKSVLILELFQNHHQHYQQHYRQPRWVVAKFRSGVDNFIDCIEEGEAREQLHS